MCSLRSRAGRERRSRRSMKAARSSDILTTAAKNAPAARTPFHARSAHPAIVFQYSFQKSMGGGGAL